jgi:anti-sigma factor RsiW
MTQHLLEWLPAYHDGELSRSRRLQVETHLQDCPSCRAELEALQGLSALLQADPLPAHTPVERFAGQVQLLLPRNSAARARRQNSTPALPGWVLGIPMTLLLVGSFLQAGLWMTSSLLATGWFFGGGAFAAWLGSDSMPDTLGTLFLLNLTLLAGIASLWMAWLAFWWVWKRNQNISVTTELLEKEY